MANKQNYDGEPAVTLDEALFTSNFESQVKLLQKSLSLEERGNNSITATAGTSKTTDDPEDTTTKKTAAAKALQQQIQKSQQSNKKSPQQPVFSHKSRKFRFGREGDEQALKTPSSMHSIIQRNTESEKKDHSSDSIGPNIIMPPPPFELSSFPQSETEDEARTSMLMSWYMAGYHTGYFEALRKVSGKYRKLE